jgi:hypothetical protein
MLRNEPVAAINFAFENGSSSSASIASTAAAGGGDSPFWRAMRSCVVSESSEVGVGTFSRIRCCNVGARTRLPLWPIVSAEGVEH